MLILPKKTLKSDNSFELLHKQYLILKILSLNKNLCQAFFMVKLIKCIVLQHIFF